MGLVLTIKTRLICYFRYTLKKQRKITTFLLNMQIICSFSDIKCIFEEYSWQISQNSTSSLPSYFIFAPSVRFLPRSTEVDLENETKTRQKRDKEKSGQKAVQGEVREDVLTRSIPIIQESVWTLLFPLKVRYEEEKPP